MEKNPANMTTELVFILDRSGSMQGLENDTIGGFNATIAKQRHEPGRAVVSTVLFDDAQDVVHNRVALQRVAPLTHSQYQVRGCTALLDAVGRAIRHINRMQKTQAAGRPDKTIFVITTDGMENASREFTLNQVRELIEKRQRKNGWEFLFLGANIDAISTAADMGIRADRASNYMHDACGTALSYDAACRAVSRMRCDAPLAAEWKGKVEADHATRGR